MVLYYILLPLAWIVFHVGFRVRAEGRDNLKKFGPGGTFWPPNHISAIDPVFVIITRFWGRRMIVFAKKELFEINAFLRWFFRCAGAVCARHQGKAAVIDETVARCQNGESLLIFPEAPVKDGTFLQPKSGLFVIAAAAAVDVVPVRIHYETPDGKMKLFCKVRVVYGEPMPAAQFAMESRRDMKKLRANKQALLDAWEKQKGENMEIRLAKTAGFCFGVNRAVELTYGLLNEGPQKVATLRPAHPQPPGGGRHEAPGRAGGRHRGGHPHRVRGHHPEPRRARTIYDTLEQRGIVYHDATCPFVKKRSRTLPPGPKPRARCSWWPAMPPTRRCRALWDIPGGGIRLQRSGGIKGLERPSDPKSPFCGCTDHISGNKMARKFEFLKSLYKRPNF